MANQPAAPPTAGIMFLLARTSHALAMEYAAALAELGISPRAYHALTRAQSAELTQTQLAELCGLDKTTMVVTMDELEHAGLAARSASPTDRRVRIVLVTEAGRRAADQARKLIEQLDAEVLGTLPTEERIALTNGLRRLVEGRLAVPAQCDRSVRRRAVRAP